MLYTLYSILYTLYSILRDRADGVGPGVKGSRIGVGDSMRTLLQAGVAGPKRELLLVVTIPII